LLFSAGCLYMLHASLAYTGSGALIGLAVVLAGLPLLLFRRPSDTPSPQLPESARPAAAE